MIINNVLLLPFVRYFKEAHKGHLYSLKDYFPHIFQALTGSIWNNIINVKLKVSVRVETFAVLHPAQEA